jgi:hypothetical protein
MASALFFTKGLMKIFSPKPEKKKIKNQTKSLKEK